MKFQKGHIPWNKGTKGLCKINVGSFKKGQKGHWLGKKRIGQRIGLWMKGKKFSEKTCKIMSEARKGKIPLCSMLGKHHTQVTKDKQSKAQKGKPKYKLRGKNNYFWIDGRTPKNTKVRNSIDFSIWREAVFEIDNFVCQKCKVKGGKLHAHHIFNFSQFINFRFELFNGITLCEKCHRKFHKIYGYSNNNKEQIDEFIHYEHRNNQKS